MARFLKSRKKSHGSPPGSLIFIGNKKMEESEIYFILYNKDSVAEQKSDNLADIPEVVPNDSVLWLNIYGLQDTELIALVAERFNIPQLEQEDILNTDQRPKITGTDYNLTVFLKVLEYRPEIEKVTGDHISIVVGKNYVITFQEKIAHNFEPVRERIRSGKGRIRKMGADYLAYTLMDTLVDMYIHTIENVGTAIEDMEQEILTQTQKSTLEKTYRLKTNMGFIRKNIWPIKEIMLYLNKTETALVDKKTLAFYKDLNDLTLQALEAVDIYFNMANDYLNIYHANVGNRTNEVMKVLTIFASIFIPLTFIAGVYGTNFNYIPELEYRYSYFIMIGGMLIVAAVMLYFFRKKDWL
jgi:magnesium transporter